MLSPVRGDTQYIISILNKLYILLKNRREGVREEGRKEGKKGGREE